MTRLRPLQGWSDIPRFCRDVYDFLCEIEPTPSINTLTNRTTKGFSRSAFGAGESAPGDSSLAFKGQWVNGSYSKGDIVIREGPLPAYTEPDDGTVAGTYIADEDIVSGDAPPGTVPSSATATVVIVAGVVTGITITAAGAGYSVAPSVTISGDGTLATAHSTLNADGSIAIVIDSGGSGYTAASAVIGAAPGTQKWKDFALGRWAKLTMRVGKHRIVLDAGRDSSGPCLFTLYTDKDDETAGSAQMNLSDLATAGHKVIKFREVPDCSTGTLSSRMYFCSEPY